MQRQRSAARIASRRVLCIASCTTTTWEKEKNRSSIYYWHQCRSFVQTDTERGRQVGDLVLHQVLPRSRGVTSVPVRSWWERNRMCFNPVPERRVPSPNRYIAVASFCFCQNNKRLIIIAVPGPCIVAPHWPCIVAPYVRVVAFADNDPANPNRMMYEPLTVCCTNLIKCTLPVWRMKTT